MGWWQLNADTLAGSRFVVSPLAEATASLCTLAAGTATHPAGKVWLAAHLPAYRERLDAVTALLVQAALGQEWIADFCVPPPTEERRTFAEELEIIRRTPSDVARADVAVSMRGSLPTELDRPDLPERIADLLEWVWTQAVLPDWPRRRRIIEADIVSRTAQLSHGGWAVALQDLRPGMGWLGDGRLQINAYNRPPRTISSGARLLFVPVTHGHAWVAWDEPHTYAVIYPCSGVLAEPGWEPVPEALGRLLGPTRAAVLVLLATPKSTTQLVALTGQGLGSVGRHLKVLLDARLVRRRRAGRSVLYYRTDAGDVLVLAQGQK
ncbi:ArsR family transcriptional regulator [Nonomuraea sp. K274]|uniref:ArsR family transcriptional regulator n=1 Tax=Nonomuraea cypriaca TaxID=1187855 RepID=A0A931AD41_9ACTN|nr:ArsR family transcriptional regulator [Nonomuraea cypriaca]MBF8187979.1 ArsR family transcriptional regulator [Nonomuraea cypriaca]